MSVDLQAVRKELAKWIGWREGPNNENPFGPAQGIAHAAYCNSGACICAYWAGYRWWPESQFGERGYAYTVTHVRNGEAHGEVRYDHASTGDPADVLAGDLLFYAWTPKTTPDHVETAYEDAAPGNSRTHNIGFNTGSPGGCYDLWRDRKYLLCRLRPSRDGGYSRGTPAPAPVPAPTPIPNHQHPFPDVRFVDDGHRHVVAQVWHASEHRWWQQLPGGPVVWEVSDVQGHLVHKGFSVGRSGIDGIGGPSTRAALLEFQAAHRLRQDAWVGAATWPLLHRDPL